MLNLSLLAGAGATGKGASAATAGTAPESAEAGKKDSLWEFASSAADVVVYFNTKQAEIAMDKKLWQRIQKDKNKAVAANPDAQFFDLKNRDMEMVANIYLYSVVPLKASIEGIANITGDVRGDIKKLLNTLSQEGGGKPEINKQGGLSKYKFSMPAVETLPPADIMFVPINNNQIQFRINLAPQQKMPQPLLSSPQGNFQLLTGDSPEEQSFVFAANLSKILSSPLMQTPKGQAFGAHIKNMRSVCIYGKVQHKHLLVTGNFAFSGPAEAGPFVQLVSGIVQQFNSQFGPRKTPFIRLQGNVVQVTGKIDIADAWKKITQGVRPSPRRSSPVRK